MHFSEKNSHDEFATAPIAYLFRKYATPSLLGLLIIGLLGITDGIFVGNYVGSNALAALNICMPIYSLVASVSLVLGIGAMTVIGTSLGQKDVAKANNSLRTAFISMSTTGVVLSSLLFIFRDEVLHFLGAEGEVLAYAQEYLYTIIPFFLVYPLWYLGDFAVKAMGLPYLSLGIMLSVVGLNIVLNYIFLAHLQLGSFGAALATGIAALVGAASLNLYLLFNRSGLTLRKGSMQPKLLPQMVYNGSSEGISGLSGGIAMLFFNKAMMGYWGADGVAALTAISYIQFLGITIFLGISDGIVPIISYNYGAQNWRRIISVVRYAFFTNLSIGVVFLLSIVFFSTELASLFFDTTTVNKSVMELASTGAVIWALAFLFNGTNILTSAYFTAISRPLESVVIALCRGMLFFIGAIHLLPEMFGPGALWFSAPVAEFLTLLVAIPLLVASFRISTLRKRIRS